ncbi:MAG TPA: hydrogenase expression/formation protein HypE [Gemmatimonadales bacterium]|nr:hydrogenase expression/formation protein HypE [Gemmatimonadales bacterium]
MSATLKPDSAAAPDELVGLKHGAGGRAMRRLIAETLAAGFVDLPVEGIGLAAMDDGAALPVGDQWLVVTTDSHVVHPIFFPGGDLGRLAIAGTVNDLAVMGATEPLGLTCAVIIEEGFRRSDLARLQRSMLDTAREAGVTIVTGDTKVMGRGELDGIVINTTGVALTRTVVPDAGLRPGDKLILTGSIGDHGVALMARRHHLALEGELRSDVAPLNGLIRLALAAGNGGVSAMKDPTRGGVASALHEMAEKSKVGIVVHEPAVPITSQVRAAAEMLGLDPFHIANEGKAILGVRPDAAAAVLGALRAHPLGREAAIIGECFAEHPGRLVLDTGLGRRLLQEPEGEPLPRIC